MKIMKLSHNSFQVLALNKELNGTTTSEVKFQLEAAVSRGITNIIIDCRGLEYISGAGYRYLLQLAMELIKQDGHLVLCSLEEYLEEVLEMAGLGEFIQIDSSVAEAFFHLQEVQIVH